MLLDEYLADAKRLDQKLMFIQTQPLVKIRHSKEGKVNLKLLANGIIRNAKSEDNEFVPISMLNMIKGSKSQKHYAENKKGSATTTIRKYINQGINRQNVTLTDKGNSWLDGLISEVLNNAEDHGLFNSWYVYGCLFETNNQPKSKEMVGEIHLAILNFGYSIYEGFENTKEINHTVFSEMDRLCETVQGKPGGKTFTKENLFSLYALQDGISRLKFEDEGRGTGTMKFIHSFLSLGDYEDKEHGYSPCLKIFSGSTMIKSDNQYKPFNINGVNRLSLNEQNDLTLPPVKTHLKNLGVRFPGTMIIAKIYLNENKLKEKLNSHGAN